MFLQTDNLGEIRGILTYVALHIWRNPATNDIALGSMATSVHLQGSEILLNSLGLRNQCSPK